MRSIPVLFSLLMLGASATVGQQLSGPIHRLPPTPDGIANCPVGMTAQQQSTAGNTLRARDAAKPSIAQALRVSFTNHSLRNISAVELEVQGTSAQGHIAPLWQDGPATVVRHIHLSRQILSSGTAASELTVDSLTSVGRIALVAVTFTDGTRWTAASSEQCATMPDPFMPIASLR